VQSVDRHVIGADRYGPAKFDGYGKLISAAIRPIWNVAFPNAVYLLDGKVEDLNRKLDVFRSLECDCDAGYQVTTAHLKGNRHIVKAGTRSIAYY
jgi:hypothetical protein